MSIFSFVLLIKHAASETYVLFLLNSTCPDEPYIAIVIVFSSALYSLCLPVGFTPPLITSYSPSRLSAFRLESESQLHPPKLAVPHLLTLGHQNLPSALQLHDRVASAMPLSELMKQHSV